MSNDQKAPAPKLRYVIFILLLSIIFLATLYQPAFSQTIPVGNFQDNQLRIRQLLGDSVTYSFSNRPLQYGTYLSSFNKDSTQQGIWSKPLRNYQYQPIPFLKLGVYDPLFINTYNTTLPYGENNGAAWYGRGLNSEIHGGFYAVTKYVTLTFRPDIVYQQNRAFEVPRFITRSSNGGIEYGSDGMGYFIDNPWRFGSSSFWTFDPGETSLRIHYKSIEGGFSTEPLWWGPGVRYALVMSNNAPGVKHFFLGSRDPIQIPLDIGKFEFNVIWGWPKDSKYFVQDYSAENVQLLKGYTRNRFMSGLNFVFSPSFAPHLYIGIARIFHQYIPINGLHLTDFTDIIEPFQKKNLASPTNKQGADVRNQLASVYLRWVFPESHAELYGEYYKEDHNWDLRDFLLEPDHDRAYTIGFQKILLSNWIDFFKVNVEFNSLQPNLTHVVRPQTYYYTHSLITEGHTNEGQILGAAIGPGSQSQFLGVDGYFDRGKLGIFIQRVAVNNFYYLVYNLQHITLNSDGTRDWWDHWVDLNIGLEGLYKWHRLLLNGKIVWNKNYNYGFLGVGDRHYVNLSQRGQYDLLNMQFQFGIQYLF